MASVATSAGVSPPSVFAVVDRIDRELQLRILHVGSDEAPLGGLGPVGGRVPLDRRVKADDEAVADDERLADVLGGLGRFACRHRDRCGVGGVGGVGRDAE
jgi:hypothetical protein